MAEHKPLPNNPDPPANEVESSTRRIDSRQWWLWSSAMAVTTLLAIGIASCAVPAAIVGPLGLSQFLFNDAVRALLAFVLVFNAYVIYEQIQIHRLRREMVEQMYSMAVLDPLTSLFNRRHIQHSLEAEIARAQRNHSQLTVILFDLDCFKEVNDHFGHHIGDRCLRAFAERLKKATRGSDAAGRWGGDEFLVVLPECKVEEVQYVLKRVKGVDIDFDGEKLPVLFSAGWADYFPGESPSEFIHRADLALYENKRRPEKRSAFARVSVPREPRRARPDSIPVIASWVYAAMPSLSDAGHDHQQRSENKATDMSKPGHSPLVAHAEGSESAEDLYEEPVPQHQHGGNSHGKE